MVGKAGGRVSVGVAPARVAVTVAVARARRTLGKLQLAMPNMTIAINIIKRICVRFTGNLLRL